MNDIIKKWLYDILDAIKNIVAHAYDAVNNAIIWGIVVNHLPKLRDEAIKLLNEPGS